jgi:hypothetical protein
METLGNVDGKMERNTSNHFGWHFVSEIELKQLSKTGI